MNDTTLSFICMSDNYAQIVTCTNNYLGNRRWKHGDLRPANTTQTSQPRAKGIPENLAQTERHEQCLTVPQERLERRRRDTTTRSFDWENDEGHRRLPESRLSPLPSHRIQYAKSLRSAWKSRRISNRFNQKKTIAAAATKTKQTNIEETRWKLLLLYKSRDWVTGGKEGMGKNRQKSTRMAEENGRESPRMADAVVINLRLH